MREAWREFLFADEEQTRKASRDPVAPAKRSAAAQEKVRRRALPDGTPAHSFATLLAELAGIVRNTCIATPTGQPASTFEAVTKTNQEQKTVLDRTLARTMLL